MNNDKLSAITLESVKGYLEEGRLRIQQEKNYDLIGPYVVLFLWKVAMESKNG